MGEKDKTEKMLESYNDVFADIFNVLLFQEKWIRQEELHSKDKEGIYKAEDGMLKSNERDVLKIYKDNLLSIATLGIENQSQIDKDMPIRIMGYDYSSYQKQIEEGKKRIPVITIVLNFSKTEWKSPLALKDIMTVPSKMEPYVQDYKIHVFNVAHLPKEVRNQFTSDFKVVADFFAEKDNPDYQPGVEEIKHVEAVLELLRVFTCDERYAKIKKEMIEKRRKGGKITMCVVLDRAEANGEKRGIQKGMQKGMQILITTCQRLNISKLVAKEQIMQGYSVSEEEAGEVVEKYWNN